MALIEDLFNLPGKKFSFAKSSEYHVSFSRDIRAASMYEDGLGLGVPTTFSTENKLRAVFNIIAGDYRMGVIYIVAEQRLFRKNNLA